MDIFTLLVVMVVVRMASQMKYIDIILQKIFGSLWAIQISQFLLILLLQTMKQVTFDNWWVC